MERFTEDKLRLLAIAETSKIVSLADPNAVKFEQHRTDYENGGVVLRIFDRQIVQVPEMGISYINLLS